MKKHPVSSCCYTDICIYLNKLNGFTIVVFVDDPLKNSHPGSSQFDDVFFSPRAASRAASPADGLHLLHLKFAGLSNWVSIFPVKKWVPKKTFI